MLIILALTVTTAKRFFNDDCMQMAAGIAYYALFSVFPLLLGLLAISGHFLEPGPLQSRVIDVLTEMVPVSREFLARNVDRLVQSRDEISMVFFIGLLWSATALFSSVGKSLDRVWGIQAKRPFLKGKLGDLVVVAIVGTVFLLATSGTPLTHLLHRQFRVQLASPTGAFSWSVSTELLPALLSVCVFAVVYRLVPRVHVAWKDVWPGALVGVALFEGTKQAFSWYLANVANLTLVYGSLAAVIAFLLWAYVSAVILLIGAELVVAYSQMFGSRRSSLGSHGVSESA